MKNETALFKLDDVQSVEKAELEKVIANGIKTFRDVGEALATIRAKKLYADEFETFEEYVKTKWDIGRAYAYRMIEAAEIAKDLSPIGDIPSEAVARELSSIPKIERVKVMKKLVSSSKPITAPRAKAVIESIAPRPIGGLAAMAMAERSNHAQPEIDLNLKPKMTPGARVQAYATVSEWWEANKTRCLGYPAVPTAQVVQQIIALFA